MEKLFVTANHYLNPQKHKTKFIALRYGNVLGSSGSVIPKFIEQISKKNRLSITDNKMTRFSITMDEALDFILKATELGQGSEIFVPKIRSYSIVDVKDALVKILEDTGYDEVGIRPGEKLHEVLINSDEMRYAWEIQNMYMILNPLFNSFHNQNISELYPNSQQMTDYEIYSSEVVERIPSSELENIIKNSDLI